MIALAVSTACGFILGHQTGKRANEQSVNEAQTRSSEAAEMLRKRETELGDRETEFGKVKSEHATRMMALQDELARREGEARKQGMRAYEADDRLTKLTREHEKTKLELAAARANPVAIMWTLNVGDSFYARYQQDTDLERVSGDDRHKLKLHITSVLRFKVLSKKAGMTTVEMVMESLELKTGDLVGIPVIFKGLRIFQDRARGAAVIATLDGNLNVSAIQGYAEFLKKLLTDPTSPFELDTLYSQVLVSGMFSEASVKQLVTSVFTGVPGRGVRVGDTWDGALPTSAAGVEATSKQKFMLEGLTDGVARIGLAGDVTFEPVVNVQPEGFREGFKVKVREIKVAKLSGSLLFNTRSGRLQESKFDMTINGDFAILLWSGAAIQESTVELESKQSITVHDSFPFPPNPYKNVAVNDFASYKMTETFGKQVVEGTSTHMVTARTDREVNLRVTATARGMEVPAQDRKIDLTKPFDPTAFGLPDGTTATFERLRNGKETIRAGKDRDGKDRDLECDWTTYKITGEYGDWRIEAEVKVWESSAVKLGVVKQELTGKKLAAGVADGLHDWKSTLELSEEGSGAP